MSQREWKVYGYVKGKPKNPSFLFTVLANFHREALLKSRQTFQQYTITNVYEVIK